MGFESRFDPIGLPEGQLASSGSDFNGSAHQGVQLPQSVVVHPLQADAAAERPTVIPPLLLLKKVDADISLLTFLL